MGKKRLTKKRLVSETGKFLTGNYPERVYGKIAIPDKAFINFLM
jgi:hypothetical protein